MDWMVTECELALKAAGFAQPNVHLNRTAPWTSDLLTDAGRAGLKKHGLAPPPPAEQGIEVPAQCPRCDSHNTQLANPFGPTLCRAIHHCKDCHETFEQFKPV
jgi:ring-1,2-phenylacetyl-CoA epoxidase subunit PaaD